jgi:hypothetical protein
VCVNVLGIGRLHLDFASATPVNSNSHTLVGSEIHASPYISTITVGLTRELHQLTQRAEKRKIDNRRRITLNVIRTDFLIDT